MKRPLLCIIPLFLILLCCSGIARRHDTAEGELEYAVSVLEKDKNLFAELNAAEYPGNGYFYIIDSKGVIVMHPEKALEGDDFSRYGFIQQILKMVNGCISFRSGSRTISIYFRGMKSGEILCFVFESSTGTETYKECKE